MIVLFYTSENIRTLQPESETFSADFTIPEYTEKVVQYGYLTIFAAAFPLGPVAVIIANFIDLYFDSRRLLLVLRRPLARRYDDSMYAYLVLCIVLYIFADQ